MFIPSTFLRLGASSDTILPQVSLTGAYTVTVDGVIKLKLEQHLYENGVYSPTASRVIKLTL